MGSTEYLFDWNWTGYNPVAVGWQDCAPGHSFGPGIREFHTIHFVLSGTGTYVIKGKEYHPKAGQLFAFSPYETVYYEADDTDPWSYVWINFVTTNTVPYRFEQPVINAPFLRPIFEELQNYPNYNTTGRDFVAGCLTQIATQLFAQHSNAASVVNNAIQYIHLNYSNENLSVAEIAEKLEINRSTFSEIFSIEKGVAPIEYLIRYRLEKACEYMTHHGLSPTVAANSVGYKNYVQFGRIFKKYYGISPRAYQLRELAKQDAE